MDDLKLPVEQQQSCTTLASLDSLCSKEKMEVIKFSSSSHPRATPRSTRDSSLLEDSNDRSPRWLSILAALTSVPRLLCCNVSFVGQRGDAPPVITPQRASECWVTIANGNKSRTLTNAGDWSVPHGAFKSGKFPAVLRPGESGEIHMIGQGKGIECYVRISDGSNITTLYFQYEENALGEWTRNRGVYSGYGKWGSWNPSQRTFLFTYQ
jgi:hypothetical protein